MSQFEDEGSQENREDEAPDPLVAEQQGKGYGEDEGEREEALPDESSA